MRCRWRVQHAGARVHEFRPGAAMDDRVIQLGRSAWELLAQIWPRRTEEYRSLVLPSVIGEGERLSAQVAQISFGRRGEFARWCSGWSGPWRWQSMTVTTG